MAPYQKNLLKDVKAQRLKGWEKIFHRNKNQKETWDSFTLYQIDFETTKIRDKKGHYIMIKRSVQSDL